MPTTGSAIAGDASRTPARDVGSEAGALEGDLADGRVGALARRRRPSGRAAVTERMRPPFVTSVVAVHRRAAVEDERAARLGRRRCP